MADSEELNASFQIAFSMCKELILCKKFRSCQTQTVTRYEIVPCLTESFQKSYARVTSNLKAICDHGWFPLNRKLLDHPTLTTRMNEEDFERERKEVWGNAEEAVAAGVNAEMPPLPAPNDDEVASYTTYSYSTGRKLLLPQDLNTESGLAGSLIEDIVIERNIVQFRGRIKKLMVEHDDGKAAFNTTKKGWK